MTGGRSGICWPNFASGHNTAPAKPHHLNMNYNAIKGLMTVQSELTHTHTEHGSEFQRDFCRDASLKSPFSIFVADTVFVGFRNVCSSETNIMFMTNPINEDLQHPIHTSGITMVDSTEEAEIFIHRPDVRSGLKKKKKILRKNIYVKNDYEDLFFFKCL